MKINHDRKPMVDNNGYVPTIEELNPSIKLLNTEIAPDSSNRLENQEATEKRSDIDNNKVHA